MNLTMIAARRARFQRNDLHLDGARRSESHSQPDAIPAITHERPGTHHDTLLAYGENNLRVVCRQAQH
jgi:hypothetical protein